MSTQHKPLNLVSAADTGARATRILIVEDERHIARMVQYFLNKAGYEVQVVGDAEEASSLLPQFEPDVLLLDLVLPGMSGIDFLQAIRSGPYNPDLIVIVLSAHWFSSDDSTLARAGATAQCAKPIAPTKLLRQLEELGAYPHRFEPHSSLKASAGKADSK